MQVLVCLFVERWHIANVPVYVHVGMVMEIVGTYKIQYHPDEDNTDKVYTIGNMIIACACYSGNSQTYMIESR